MHIDVSQIDRMDFAELDDLRHQLRVSKAKLCEMAEFDPSTYQRWMRHVQGRVGGSCPLPRSVKAIREVLREVAVAKVNAPSKPAEASRPAA